MKKSRRWLYLVLCAGLIALGAGGGTFASFNATTTNKTNTFSTGSLTLTDSSCKSTSSASNSATCSGIVTVSSHVFAPNSAIFGTVTIKNGGTLTAFTFKVKGDGCTPTKLTTTTTAPGVHSFNTTSDFCTKLELFIEETGHTATTADTHCWYGVSGTHALCAASAKLSGSLTAGEAATTLTVKTRVGTFTSGSALLTTKTGKHSQSITIASDTANTLHVTSFTANAAYATGSYIVETTALATATTVEKFATTEATPGVTLTALKGPGATTKTANVAALGSTATRNFRIGIFLPTTLTNKYQNLTAKFGIKWYIQQ